MSAHFKVTEIGFFSLEQWPVTVCAWRGCCIEVFARAEHSVAACIETLSDAGFHLSNDAYHPGAVARLRALDACLKSHDFQGHEKKARERIAQWQAHCDTRTLLAHGKLTATQDGITVEPMRLAGKKSVVIAPKAFTRLEMLAFLAELERCQLLLHQQLSHIKALARTAKAVPAANQPATEHRPG